MTLNRPTPSLASKHGSSAVGEPSPASPIQPSSPIEKATPSHVGLPAPARLSSVAAEEAHMDNTIVQELTNRLPTSELVKIIKGALECGRQNIPFTESDLLRAMAFGVSSTSRALPQSPKRDTSTTRR